MKLTATEQRIYDLLRDGQPRSPEEILKRCLTDPLATPQNLYRHLAAMKHTLKSEGVVVCSMRFGDYTFYKMYRLEDLPLEIASAAGIPEVKRR